MRHRVTEYTIDYIGADGCKRGREFCLLTSHGDGRRTLRTRSEIFDAEVLRDVVYTVDQSFRPIDALIRVSLRDRFVGTGLFLFGPECAECECNTEAGGRASQRITLTAPATSFMTHAVSSDVWHGACIEKTPGMGAQQIDGLFSSSPLHNGSTGPLLGRWPLQAHQLGIEAVEVLGGSIEAEHIRYEEPTGELFLDTWCTTDADRVMLRMTYPAYISSYVLTSLRRDQPAL